MPNTVPAIHPSPEYLVSGPAEPRLSTAIRLEFTILIIRYVGYIMVFLSYITGTTTDYTPSLAGITVGLVLQNAWVHYVLYTEKYNLLLTPLNFAMHLGKISLIVVLTGGANSPFVPLFVLPIIGYCMCSTDYRSTYRVTFCTAGAYAMIVLVSWLVGAFDLTYPVSFYFFLILLAGWMMNALGERVRTVEDEGLRRARALASSEATLRAILNSTDSPIVVCQENELIADVNEGASEFIGLPRQEMVGRRIRAFLFDDGTLPTKLATLRTKGQFHGEAMVLTADGEERMVDLRVRSYIHNDQRFFVAMLHDITSAKNLQEASRLTNLRLEQVNRELQQVNQLRTAFFSTVSSRLRSPLCGVLGFVDMLLNEELGEVTPEQRNALHSSRRGLQRVFKLLDETAAAARPSAGRMN